jgi:hypothetical protein
MIRWYSDRATRLFIARRYLPWLGGLNLVWEVAHLPLYTLWREAPAWTVAYSVMHCTLGDVVIGGTALVLALMAAGEGALAHWRWGRIGTLATLIGAGYTVVGESVNIALLQSWSYSKAMPTIGLAGFEVGLSPVAQWLVLPAFALFLASRASTGTRHGLEAYQADGRPRG